MSLMAYCVDIQCDDCFHWERVVGATTERRARQVLRTRGWHTMNPGVGASKADFCPGCWKGRSEAMRISAALREKERQDRVKRGSRDLTGQPQRPRNRSSAP